MTVIPRILTAEQREALAEAIRLLIDVLDASEPDADFEDDGTGEPEEMEPSLGWTSTLRQRGIHWHGALDRHEVDIEADPADGPELDFADPPNGIGLDEDELDDERCDTEGDAWSESPWAG